MSLLSNSSEAFHCASEIFVIDGSLAMVEFFVLFLHFTPFIVRRRGCRSAADAQELTLRGVRGEKKAPATGRWGSVPALEASDRGATGDNTVGPLFAAPLIEPLTSPYAFGRRPVLWRVVSIGSKTHRNAPVEHYSSGRSRNRDGQRERESARGPITCVASATGHEITTSKEFAVESGRRARVVVVMKSA